MKYEKEKPANDVAIQLHWLGFDVLCLRLREPLGLRRCMFRLRSTCVLTLRLAVPKLVSLKQVNGRLFSLPPYNTWTGASEESNNGTFNSQSVT
jgi:hypothetical protein